MRKQLRRVCFVAGVAGALLCTGCRTTSKWTVEYEYYKRLEWDAEQLEEQRAPQKLPDWWFRLDPNFQASW